MRIYISGPISGIKNGNIEEFNMVERAIEGGGNVPVNPHKLNHSHDKAWVSYMREDIAALLLCDAICMLPGWRNSHGARLERKIAKKLGMKIIISGGAEK